MSGPVRVFISYSHDSMSHSDLILKFAQRLRRDGIDCMIDQFSPFPNEGWVGWMERHLEASDFILCVCTEKYRSYFGGAGTGPAGRGSNWEGQIVAQYIYDQKGRNSRFIPVIVGDQDADRVIPRALKPYTYFVLDRQYDPIYRLLTGQRSVSPEPVGAVRQLAVVSPGTPATDLPLDQAYMIDSQVRVIAGGPDGPALEALDKLERLVNYVGGSPLRDAAIQQLVSYISALDTSVSYPIEERLRRVHTIRALIRLTDGKLNAYFVGRALSGIDLAMFDFRGAYLAVTDFSESFMIECDFRGVVLDGSSFRDCRIRNVRFDGASLRNVDFTGADWFNSIGLVPSQLAECKTHTLLSSPSGEDALLSHLDSAYRYPFSSWGRRIQEELHHTWAAYDRPGGIMDEIVRWREQGKRRPTEP
jgi:hypothetical protein